MDLHDIEFHHILSISYVRVSILFRAIGILTSSSLHMKDIVKFL